MRGKSKKSSPAAVRRKIVTAKVVSKPAQFSEKKKALAALDREHAKLKARIERTYDEREFRLKAAVKTFRPRKSERGSIVFVGVRGGRIPHNSNRRGYAVYVDSKGRKNPVRQLSRDTGKVERIPIARRITALDVTRVKSKKAKRNFLTARMNPVARREIRRAKGGKGISTRGTRYAGKFAADSFYTRSDSVEVLALELCKASNSQQSKRDFLVTVGIHVHETKSGKRHWIEVRRRFSRKDGQIAEIPDVKDYFGQEIYAFMARELESRGLVLSGSARHVARLAENQGNEREVWTKDGFEWKGRDAENVKIESIEYRIDQLTLGK